MCVFTCILVVVRCVTPSCVFVSRQHCLVGEWCIFCAYICVCMYVCVYVCLLCVHTQRMYVYVCIYNALMKELWVSCGCCCVHVCMCVVCSVNMFSL